MEEELLLQQDIVEQIELPLVPGLSPDLFRQKLADYINLLINNDFNRLILLLYRLDVSEPKLKQLLASSPNCDAGNIIAALIIERQLEKIKSRSRFKPTAATIPEDERW